MIQINIAITPSIYSHSSKVYVYVYVLHIWAWSHYSARQSKHATIMYHHKSDHPTNHFPDNDFRLSLDVVRHMQIIQFELILTMRQTVENY